MLAAEGAGVAVLAAEAGSGDILTISLDGGAHWHAAISATCCGCFGWADLRLVNAFTAFFFGPTHYAAERLYRTEDGGRIWQTIPLPRA